MSFENFYYLYKNDSRNINNYNYDVYITLSFVFHKSILYTLQYPRVAANNTGGVDPGTVPGSAFLATVALGSAFGFPNSMIDTNFAKLQN